MANVYKLYQQMEYDLIDPNDPQSGLLIEDRREYAKEDLQKMYSLTADEAKDLHELIQAYFDPNAVDLTECSKSALQEALTDAIEQGLDGWRDDQLVTIRLFLHDIGKAVYYIMQDRPTIP